LAKSNGSEPDTPAPPDQLAQRAAALKQRFRDWSERLERVIHDRTVKATEYLANAEKLHRQTKQRAKTSLAGWHGLQERFTNECTRLDALIAEVDTAAKLKSAEAELERAENRFANEIKIESSGAGG
jgi:hypothetical protein